MTPKHIDFLPLWTTEGQPFVMLFDVEREEDSVTALWFQLLRESEAITLTDAADEFFFDFPALKLESFELYNTPIKLWQKES